VVVYKMRIELVIFAITAFFIANVYTDGKYWKLLQTNQKYYKMAGIALAGFVVYVLFKKFPSKAHEIIRGSNEYFKYLPVDKETMGMLNPILDFTSKQNMYHEHGSMMPILPLGREEVSTNRILNSGRVEGGGSTKSNQTLRQRNQKEVCSESSKLEVRRLQRTALRLVRSRSQNTARVWRQQPRRQFSRSLQRVPRAQNNDGKFVMVVYK